MIVCLAPVHDKHTCATREASFNATTSLRISASCHARLNYNNTRAACQTNACGDKPTFAMSLARSPNVNTRRLGMHAHTSKHGCMVALVRLSCKTICALLRT